MQKRSKRAFTLIELSVVIAIMSIIAVLSAGFTVAFSNRAKVNNTKLSLMQNLLVLKQSFSTWVDDCYRQNPDGSFTAQDGCLTFGDCSLSFADGVLTSKLGENQTSFNFDKINSISFKLEHNQNKNDYLFLCNVIYSIAIEDDSAVKSYLITYNSAIGESFVVENAGGGV